MKLRTWLGMALVALAAGMATADDLAVSAYWQDHMVLQRGKPITVWGKDAAGRKVTVEFADQKAIAETGADGFWETTFAEPFALSADPQTLTITDDAGETIALRDVLVGDVFLAGGQSNMDRRLDYNDFHEPQSIKDFCGDDDGIRFIRIARSAENATSGEQLFDLPPIKPVDDANKYYGEGFDWASATMNGTSSNKYHVSSVALNFAHYLRRANAERGENIPIGIVHASSGGTAIREWIAPSVLNDNGIHSPGSAASSDGWFWNNMMAPLLRAEFRAVLWYQGCSDAQMATADYKKLMDVLVKDRRNRWGDRGDLPFYAVQIATPGYGPSTGTVGYDDYPAPTEGAEGHNYVRVREAQRLWDASDAGTHGLVTIVDCVKCLGAGDLHPTDKNFVGRRLSLLARRDLYGETALQAEGPAFTRAVREADGAVRVFFRPGTAQGLTAGRVKPASDVELSRWVKKGSDPIRGFALCGEDGTWQDAEATVEGETVVLRAEGVASPAKFHYGYWCITRSTELEDGQRLNLYNGAGLPMSPVAPQAVEDPDSSAKVADPVLLPASCYFTPSTNVTISCATSGATIRYTLDGGDPAESSTAYTGPIALSATTTVKARAFADGKEASEVVFATYTLGEPPAPQPNPQWTNGAYEPSEWRSLGTNLLAGATASHTGTLPNYASQDMGKLVDGKVPVEFSSDEVVGFGDMEATWEFAEPKTIGKIRISSRWSDTVYDNIGVNDVYVLKNGEWVALGVPNSHKSGVSSITTGALTATLEDEELGYLAQNVTGLKISFNKAGSPVANYYAEVEAIAPGGEVQPLETVETPTFDPAACSFFPSTNVALACSTEGATIRYTLDGSTPTASSAAYETPIALTATTTVKARAYAESMEPSAVATATYTLVDPVTTHDITIAACENGTLETSATNNVAAGTTVTVIATPAAGYRLASVTTNGAALAGATFAMPDEDVTVAATFEEEVVPPGDKMFYIGDTGYDSWAEVYAAAKAGDTIVVVSDAAMNPPVTSGVLGKSLTIDLNGHTLQIVECWLTGCTVAVVDTGAPAGSGRFDIQSSRLNLSGGTLDLSALASDQVTGDFQMSSTSLLKFPYDRSLAYSTSDIAFDGVDPEHGVGARIVVRGLTYMWDGVSWGVSFMITSIAVGDEFVELGVLVAPEYGESPNVTILGCETLNGEFHVRADATTSDGALYYVPVSDDRFFKAVMGM